jgi:non-heme chloroperoxidase
VIHGSADQVVPYEVGVKASAALIDGAKLLTYDGAPHGITDTHKEQLGNDLLEFLRS